MSWRIKLRAALPNRAARVRVPKPHITLTFDDGPHPVFTPKILDLLAQHQVQATFFLIGKNVEEFPDVARSIHEQGHELANHSYSHPDLRKLSIAQIDEQLDRTDRLLAAIDGATKHQFRAPWGYVDMKVLKHCWRRKQAAIHWSVDSLDYRKKGSGLIVDRFQEHPPKGGDIVLLHDDNSDTLEALQTLLPQWKQQDLSLTTVSQALGHRQ